MFPIEKYSYSTRKGKGEEDEQKDPNIVPFFKKNAKPPDEAYTVSL